MLNLRACALTTSSYVASSNATVQATTNYLRFELVASYVEVSKVASKKVDTH